MSGSNRDEAVMKCIKPVDNVKMLSLTGNKSVGADYNFKVDAATLFDQFVQPEFQSRYLKIWRGADIFSGKKQQVCLQQAC